MDWAVFVKEAKQLMASSESAGSYASASRRLQAAALGDLLGFFVILTAMISRRFL